VERRQGTKYCWPHFLRCRKRSVWKSWKSTFSITPLSLYWRFFSREPLEYSHKPYIPESLGYIFVADSMSFIFIQIFVVGSERRMYFETECVMAPQGQSRSLILAPIENAYACDLQLVINSNLGRIFPRFKDIPVFLLRTSTPLLLHTNFGVFPFGLGCQCCGRGFRSEDRRPYS